MRSLVALWVLVLLVGTAACSSDSDPGPSSDPGPAGMYAPPEGTPSEVLELHEDGSFCLIEEDLGMVEVSGTWSADGGNVSLTAETIVADGQTITPPPSEATEEGTLEGDTITDPEGKKWVRTDDPTADCG